jgi:serine/threonine protein kinase
MSPADIANEVDSAILEVALSLDDEEARARFLDRTFSGDATGHAEMLKLVESARGAGSYFLEAGESRSRVASEVAAEFPPSVAPVDEIPGDPNEEPGCWLGRYRLVQRIGEGGWGVVYEAEQEQPVRRRVAVKIVRLGMNTEQVIARFELERQALALMDHPNISRVIDAGATISGRPYFVMELVSGEKITNYCDRHRLRIRDRLHLFIDVCHAIQHAHQKGVIHRDIKPSNILVAAQNGRHLPKVIDFGIAKATDPQLSGGTIFTAHDQLVGTPAYMSPEQIDLAGTDVDTRSDVFSLGVLLCELLTSRTPFGGRELAAMGISKIRETILHSQPSRPTELLAGTEKAALLETARNRQAEPLQLIGSVRGDLDWIVMKAMEKSRSRRYQTVNSLALDVQRYLEDQPVLARPPAKTYLIGKFVRRNRAAVVAGVSLAFLLIAALVVTSTMYKREQLARNQQVRLREEAQRARNEESRLRRQADARSNLGRVAFLLDQGRIDEADALRQQYPISSVEPSREAAAVFRSLGDWNARHDRWDQALMCFQLLRQANRLDEPDKLLDNADLIAISAALIRESPTEYMDFRREMIASYQPARDQRQAEHLLKSCLLAPTDEEALSSLRPAVEVMGDPQKTSLPSWSGLALALYHYRSGRLDDALQACEIALNDPQAKLSCRVTLMAVSSMIHSAMGKTKEAEADLAKANEWIAGANDEDSIAGKPTENVWFDWTIAEALVREAGGKLESR